MITIKLKAYGIAKIQKIELENQVKRTSDCLKKYKKDSFGLTPDEIKFSDKYIEEKANYQKAFENLRNFNAYFNKTFKKEIALERKTKMK